MIILCRGDENDTGSWPDASFETGGNNWAGLTHAEGRFVIFGSACRTWYSSSSAAGSRIDISSGLSATGLKDIVYGQIPCDPGEEPYL